MKKKSLYQTNQWAEFRELVIELDGNKCTICGRSRDEVVLQVHHLRYIPERKPWEYATNECRTLCKGCHASEHGIVMPKVGWEYLGEEDLGDLIGTCDNCGSSLRHQFFIFHENWGTIGVGTYCCDVLTDSNIASNLVESQKRYDERKKRFVNSKRWKNSNNVVLIKQSGFSIKITQIIDSYYITINQLESSKKYTSLIDAQEKVFDVIESGKLIDYFNEKKIPFDKKKTKHKE